MPRTCSVSSSSTSAIPRAPVKVGEYRPGARPFDNTPEVFGAYESSGRVYVSVESRGFVVLDADTLEEVGVCTFVMDSGSVYVEGQTAYVCGDTLQLYDLSQPNAPVLKGYIEGFGVLSDLRPSVGQTFATVGPGIFTGLWTPTPSTFERLAGLDRFGTGAAVSQRTGNEWGSDVVVLATGRDFPDALAGAPLAYQLEAPLLLCEKSSIPASVTAEIRRVGATKAVILGSESVVDANVVSQLHSIFGTTSPDVVGRIGGRDRFETAAMIAEQVIDMQGDERPHAAFVTTGRNYPDALSASGLAALMGYPILLTETGSVPPATAEALESLDITQTIVLGSDRVVSGPVYTRVHGKRRLAGATRYDTSADDRGVRREGRMVRARHRAHPALGLPRDRHQLPGRAHRRARVRPVHVAAAARARPARHRSGAGRNASVAYEVQDVDRPRPGRRRPARRAGDGRGCGEGRASARRLTARHQVSRVRERLGRAW